MHFFILIKVDKTKIIVIIKMGGVESTPPKQIPRDEIYEEQPETTIHLKFVEKFNSDSGPNPEFLFGPGEIDEKTTEKINSLAAYLENDNRDFDQVIISVKTQDGAVQPFVPNRKLFISLSTLLKKRTFKYRSICRRLLCNFKLVRSDYTNTDFVALAQHGKSMAAHISMLMHYINMVVVDIDLLYANKMFTDPHFVEDDIFDDDDRAEFVVFKSFRQYIVEHEKYTTWRHRSGQQFELFPLIDIALYVKTADTTEIATGFQTNFELGTTDKKMSGIVEMSSKLPSEKRIIENAVNSDSLVQNAHLELKIDSPQRAELFISKAMINELAYFYNLQRGFENKKLINVDVKFIGIDIPLNRCNSMRDDIVLMLNYLHFNPTTFSSDRNSEIN